MAMLKYVTAKVKNVCPSVKKACKFCLKCGSIIEKESDDCECCSSKNKPIRTNS